MRAERQAPSNSDAGRIVILYPGWPTRRGPGAPQPGWRQWRCLWLVWAHLAARRTELGRVRDPASSWL